MPYGLTTDGFIPKPQEVLEDEVKASLRTAFGNSLALHGSSVLGQLVTIFCSHVAQAWEMGQAVHAAQDPDAATGEALDAVAAIVGVVREEARPSTVTLTLTGTPGSVIPTGSRASVVITERAFTTLADATLVALTAWAGSTVYAIGAKRTNNGHCYVCIDAGTSAASPGPQTTGSAIVDNGVVWRWLGEGTAVAAVAAESVDLGPIEAVSGDLTVIDTPVGGWQGVVNELDADPGALIETDEALRIRREDELSASGTSPVPAIRAALLALPDVSHATVFHNATDTTNADGIPPHAVEAVVLGGTDQAVFDCLRENVAAGIATHGTEAGTSEDEEGNLQPVEFTRPDLVEVYVSLTLTKDARAYPTDGDARIKAAIVSYGDSLPVGHNVHASAMLAQAFQVPGVLNVSAAFIGTSPSPGSSSSIDIDLRELAVYDTSRIVITTSSAIP